MGKDIGTQANPSNPCEPRKKPSDTFQYTAGCWIGILIMVYYTLHIPGYIVQSSFYPIKSPCIVHYVHCSWWRWRLSWVDHCILLTLKEIWFWTRNQRYAVTSTATHNFCTSRFQPLPTSHGNCVTICFGNFRMWVFSPPGCKWKVSWVSRNDLSM